MSVAQQWLKAAGIDLAQVQKDIDSDLKPRSRATGVRVSGNVDVRASFVQTDNVAAMLPGKGKLAHEVVVLGAHYDHLGMGGPGSLRPNVSAIHNGADDNASGDAAVLAAAERLTKSLANVKDRRTIVFAWFSAEESGLGGSSYFVSNPPVPLINPA